MERCLNKGNASSENLKVEVIGVLSLILLRY